VLRLSVSGEVVIAVITITDPSPNVFCIEKYLSDSTSCTRLPGQPLCVTALPRF
jgi:hypothetical protein